KAAPAADGGQPFLFTRAPSPFLTKQIASPSRRRAESGVSVGGEIEAWCGKCKELRAHRVVVVHDGKPHRVQCVHCKSQHGYRTEPTARGSATGDGEAPRKAAGGPRIVDPEAARRRIEREKLASELQGASAAEVRSFDPAGSYKSGQIIDHPKYGRG